jgi:YidC/Oxa1 family membrane protein insertase
MFVVDIFITVIYQPFLNILVSLYWALGLLAETAPDMGIAVILLTIIIRVLLLPMSLAGHKSEADRREIAEKVKEIEDHYAGDPIKMRQARKRVFKKSSSVIVGEMMSLFIQVAIALMLWQMFETGLKGKDLHLIYPFIPKVDLPFNLMFLGKYDLSKTSFTLNFIQSLLIFVFETINILTSPYPPGKGEVVRMQLTLPVVSFLIFMGLPAGKKLFVITTLIFSIILSLIRFMRRKFADYRDKAEKNEADEEAIAAGEIEPVEQVVVKG